MNEANKKSSKSSAKNTKKKAKPPCRIKRISNTCHDQRVTFYHQAYYCAQVAPQAFFYDQQNRGSDPRGLAYKPTTIAAWSDLATPEYDVTSRKQTEAHDYTMVDETYTYELERWAYETSHKNLTLAEKLEKEKWEAKGLERL